MNSPVGLPYPKHISYVEVDFISRRARAPWRWWHFRGARAASPQLTRIVPARGQRGTEVVLSFDGQRLADAQEVLLYEPGLTVTKIEPPADKKLAGKQVKVTVKIAPDARLGEYQMRLRTATGISELKTFWVGTLPIVGKRSRTATSRRRRRSR